MPRNKFIYVGVLVVAASALLYIGGQIIRTIEWFLPWSAGVGIALILIGLFVEMRKSGKPTPIASGSAVNEQKSTTAQTQDTA
ncbi:MAG: hypothetical protein KatS3mg016_1231 [Fimbriimonadales bacterium]|nr:MAG: hypothetical protein KatS3mg016_1231 [Fimbriimonadales bacterium]